MFLPEIAFAVGVLSAQLCSTPLRCIFLCCAWLRCAALRCSPLCIAARCYAALRSATLCCAEFHYAAPYCMVLPSGFPLFPGPSPPLIRLQRVDLGEPPRLLFSIIKGSRGDDGELHQMTACVMFGGRKGWNEALQGLDRDVLAFASFCASFFISY